MNDLKEYNREKVDFIKDEIAKLLDYHMNVGAYGTSLTYVERIEESLLYDLLKKIDKMKDVESVKNLLKVRIQSMDPL